VDILGFEKVTERYVLAASYEIAISHRRISVASLFRPDRSGRSLVVLDTFSLRTVVATAITGLSANGPAWLTVPVEFRGRGQQIREVHDPGFKVRQRPFARSGTGISSNPFFDEPLSGAAAHLSRSEGSLLLD